jgi:aspartate racemase
MNHLLLLGTRFTMEDGFFEAGLRRAGLEVSVPDAGERQEIQAIQSRLAVGENRLEFSKYFADLLGRYSQADAAVLGCTELPLAITPQISPLPLLDPAQLQVNAAVDFMLA